MKKTLIIILVLVAGLSWLSYSMLKLGQVKCSLCVNYNGRSQCSEALGPNEAAAAEEAHRNACAVMTSGVTEVVACNHAAVADFKCERSQ